MLFSGVFQATLPEQASTFAPDVDRLYDWVMIISVVGFIGLMLAMFYFIFKYKRVSENDKTPHIDHNTTAEAIWTIIPTIIFVGIAIWGLVVYKKMITVPENAIKVEAIGRKWMWEFIVKNGEKDIRSPEMYVPVSTPILVDIKSMDVLHAFFVPAFRVKKDAVPGRTTQVWFEATQTGKFRMYCAEYCGTSHSRMVTHVNVLSKEDYAKWIEENSKEVKKSVADMGKDLFSSKACISCHSIDGATLVGPALNGIWGKEHEMSDGSKVKVDEAYLRESILNAKAKIVKGFQPVMPMFQGQLSEDEVNQLIAYLKALSGQGGGTEGNAEAGQKHVQMKGCVACHSADGSKLVGPSFKGLYGSKREFADGSSTEANDDYIKESIWKPTAKVVKGFQPTMPPFEGAVSEQEIADIIAYFKTLK